MRTFAFALLACAALASAARAQEQPVGEGANALPSLLRLGVPEVGPTRAAIALGGRFGYLEAMPDADASRERFDGDLAASARVAPWLALGIGSSLQHDTRGGSLERAVDAVTALRLTARASTRVHGAGRLGFELAARTPSGTDASPAFAATSIEGRALLAFAAGAHTTLAGNLGLRLDRSARAVDAAQSLSPAQRIAAALSDYDAFLLGFGVGHRLGQTELLGELSADVLVGSNSALLGSSPMRAQLGARYHAGPLVQLELGVGATASARPRLRPSDALVPIEPRIEASFGVRIAWPEARAELPERSSREAPRAAPLPAVRAVPPKPVAPPPPREPAPPPSAEVPASTAAAPDTAPAAAEGAADAEAAGPSESMAQIRGHVRAFSGEALKASITLYPRNVKANTDEQGFFQIDVPPGKYTVRLRAYGYESQNRRVQADPNGVTVLNVELRKKGH